LNKSDDYAYGIDALRFFAAMIVAVFHLTYRTVEGAMIMPFGWVGVGFSLSFPASSSPIRRMAPVRDAS